MGTALTVATQARVRIRDADGRQFSDTQVLGLINDICDRVYRKLAEINSVLIYTEDTVTTVDGTENYSTLTALSFMRHGSWVSGSSTPLMEIAQPERIVQYGFDDTSEGQPIAFYMTRPEK